MKPESPTASVFAQHVKEGLNARQAFLSSRFIYDQRGSALFQEIMGLDAYYLTRAETEIFSSQTERLIDTLATGMQGGIELIEFGAGDGTKTKILLNALFKRGVDFSYRPIDISKAILEVLGQNLRQELPSLRFDPIVATYEQALVYCGQTAGDAKRVFLFLGSNIGNFPLPGAQAFCQSIGEQMQLGDLFLLGVDLRKNPRKILAAYDDAEGVTRAFNLNLLHRMQTELDAELTPEDWSFYPTYNPETGEVRSYLHPIRETTKIRIPALGIDRSFTQEDVIHTEISRKYSLSELEELGKQLSCSIIATLHDKQRLFADVIYAKK